MWFFLLLLVPFGCIVYIITCISIIYNLIHVSEEPELEEKIEILTKDDVLADIKDCDGILISGKNRGENWLTFYYCQKCGSELLFTRLNKISFDGITGRKIKYYEQVCPKHNYQFLKEKKSSWTEITTDIREYIYKKKESKNEI
jgi:hypothetical protein